MIVQLEFFKTREECEEDSIRIRIRQIEESTGKVRRALFARYSELWKKQLELEERLKVLEKHICNK